MTQITGRAAALFLLSGLLGWIANIFRFVALSLAPASIVTPLASTVPVFLLFFSFLLNRNLEIFNLPIIIGAVTVVIGSVNRPGFSGDLVT